MAIIKDTFDIPDDIAIGLASGLYIRIGGVVRYAIGSNKGQIVKHLKSISLPSETPAALSATEQLYAFGKNHKKLLIGFAAIASGIAAIGSIYAVYSLYKRTRFQKAFKQYIDAIRAGELNVEIIENLENELSNIKSVNLKSTELLLLIDHIRNYTIHLAENNTIDLDTDMNENIIDLKQYLEIQKNILKSV